MPFRELVTKCRNYRRFDGTVPVSEGMVRELVELACYAPSVSNLQPLKYIAICDPSLVAALYPCLSLTDSPADCPGLAENDSPRAFIVMLGDFSVSSDFAFDSGIAAQTMLLGATASGLGGFISGFLEPEKVRKLLKIPESFSILMAIALGKPVGTVVIDQMGDDDSVCCFRDANGIHHVPKRVVDDVLLNVL